MSWYGIEIAGFMHWAGLEIFIPYFPIEEHTYMSQTFTCKTVRCFQGFCILGIVGFQLFPIPVFPAELEKNRFSQEGSSPLSTTLPNGASRTHGGLPDNIFIDSDGNIIQQLPHRQKQKVGQVISTMSAKASSIVIMGGNLDATQPVMSPFSISSLLADPFGAGTTQFSTSFQVFDSLGVPHDLMITWTKIAGNTWQYYGLARDSEVMVTTGNSNPSTEYALVLQGKLGFNTSGFLDTESVPQYFNASGNGVDFNNGSENGQMLKIDFGMSLTTDGGTGGDGMLQQGSRSILLTLTQDGFSPGILSGITITESRDILGYYDNGQTKVFGQMLPTLTQHPDPKPNKHGRGDTKRTEETRSHPARGIPAAISAVQSGVWTVGQFGTWHVNVGNDFEHPVPVQDISLTTKKPWAYTQSFQFRHDSYSAEDLVLTVPPGSRLFIHHVSLQSTSLDLLPDIKDPQVIASVHTMLQDSPVIYQLGLSDVFRTDKGDIHQVRHILNKPVGLYADTNTRVRVIVERNYEGEQQEGIVSLTGYLEHMP